MACREESGMKKIIAILGILCLLAGGGLIVGGFAANGWKSFEPHYEQKFYQSEGIGLTSVDLNAETVPVSVEIGNTEELTVEYYVNDNIEITVAEENGVLKITEKSPERIGLRWIYQFAKRPVMRIILPKQSADSELALNLKSHVSNIAITGRYAEAAIGITAGNITIDEASFQKLSAVTTTGNILISDSEAEEISLKCTTGNMVLSDVVTTVFTAKNATGNLTVTDFVTERFDSEATTGDVYFNSLNAKSVKAKVTTGNIKGSLCGKVTDYTLRLSATTGNTSPSNRETENGREVIAETTTGNIKLTFTEN